MEAFLIESTFRRPRYYRFWSWDFSSSLLVCLRHAFLQFVKKELQCFLLFYFLYATPASLFLHWEFSKWGSRLMDHMMSKSVTKTLVGRTHGWGESRQRPGMIFETRFLFILPAVFNFCTKRSCKRKFEILKSNHSSIEFLWCENANTDPVGGCRKQRCIYTVTWWY